MRSYIAHIIITVMLVFANVSCNHEVFVPDSEPSVSSLMIDGNGDTLSFKISTKQLRSVIVTQPGVIHTIYDSNGNAIVSDSESYSASIPDDGKVVFDTNMFYLEIVRDSRGEIIARLSRNFYREINQDFTIELNYRDVSYNIPVWISPSAPYEYAGISYDMDSVDVSSEFRYRTKLIRYSNNYTANLNVDLYPLRDELCTAQFEFEPLYLGVLHEESATHFIMPIVDAAGNVTFKTVYGRLDYLITLETEYGRDIKYTLTIPPLMLSNSEIKCMARQVTVPAVILLQNKSTARIVNFYGKVKVACPVSFDVNTKFEPIQ